MTLRLFDTVSLHQLSFSVIARSAALTCCGSSSEQPSWKRRSLSGASFWSLPKSNQNLGRLQNFLSVGRNLSLPIRTKFFVHLTDRISFCLRVSRTCSGVFSRSRTGLMDGMDGPERGQSGVPALPSSPFSPGAGSVLVRCPPCSGSSSSPPP